MKRKEKNVERRGRRWLLALAAAALGLLLPACSKTVVPSEPAAPASAAPTAGSPASPSAASRPDTARGPAGSPEQPWPRRAPAPLSPPPTLPTNRDTPEARPGPKRTPATGEARRHPFAPELDAEARRAQLATGMGPLVLKAIFEGPVRAAILQEGEKTHLVREGESVGGLTVVAIHEGEVVLGAGQRKQVLLLYEH